MPIYEYVCQDCQYKFETIRSMKDADAPINCEHCQSGKTSRAISLFSAQSGGHVIAGGNGGCAGCSSGSCSSCGG
jgi:putative FmdB family regulatory protein